MKWIKCSDKLPEDNQRVLVKIDRNKWMLMDEYRTCTWSPYWVAELQCCKFFFVENCLYANKFEPEDIIGWIPFEKLDEIEVDEK